MSLMLLIVSSANWLLLLRVHYGGVGGLSMGAGPGGTQGWRANDFRFRGKLDWRYYRRTKVSELAPEEKAVQSVAVRYVVLVGTLSH
jgi:hypothetical protein